MSKETLRQIIVFLVIIATIVMNVVAAVLPLNGQNTGQIADQFDILFVPAGYVFTIWGIIYLGLIAFAVYQALPSQRFNPRLRKAALPFIVGNLANIVWLFLWHYLQFPPTLVAMLALLLSLIFTYLSLEIGRTQVSAAERWAVRIPVSIYLGWVTVATIANITQVLYYLGWNGAPLAPEAWAIIMLVIAAIVNTAMLLTRRDIAYALVFVWAAIGIAAEQAAYPSVATAAWIVAVMVALASLLAALKVLPAWRPKTAV